MSAISLSVNQPQIATTNGIRMPCRRELPENVQVGLGRPAQLWRDASLTVPAAGKTSFGKLLRSSGDEDTRDAGEIADGFNVGPLLAEHCLNWIERFPAEFEE